MYAINPLMQLDLFLKFLFKNKYFSLRIITHFNGIKLIKLKLWLNENKVGVEVLYYNCFFG